MRPVVTRAILLAALALCSLPAGAAEQCTISGGDRTAAGFADAVASAMKTAWSCGGAYQILEACQSRSPADDALSQIVLSKCEPMFTAKATPAVKTAYQSARDKCNQAATKKKDAKTQEQMSVCFARASRDFARKYGAKS